MSNILVDISGNHNNGTINGAISTKNGMAFDGVKSYIPIGSGGFGSLVNNGVFTVALRFYIDDFSSRRILFGDYNNIGAGESCYFEWSVAVDDFVFSVRTAGGANVAITTSFPQVAGWYDAILTWNGTNATIFIDAVNSGTNNDNPGTIENGTTLSIGRGGDFVGLYFNGQIVDFLVFSKVFTEQEIKQYHNQFVNPVIIEDFQNKPVGEFPIEWQKESGAFEIKENTSGNKYLECTINGVAKLLYKDTLLGTASIDYYDGATWTTYEDTLVNLISTHAWLSHDGQYLKFTLTNGDRIDNLIITNGIKQ